MLGALAERLAEQSVQIGLGKLYRHRAAGRFGCVEQIQGQRAHALCLLFKDANIFLRGFVRNVTLFEQIDIGDDAGQRCFDVVRHIGNQFGF